MPHLFLGRSQRLFLFFFLFLFFLKDTKSVHLNFQYILAALWCYTNVRAASRKVASLDWKRSCLISQSQLGPGWRQHKAGDWQQKVCSSRMERSRVKRGTEWCEKKQKCSSHKTAGPHGYAPVPWSRCWLHGFNVVCCWIAANCFFQVIWDLMRTTPTPLAPLNHPPMCSYILTHPTPEKRLYLWPKAASELRIISTRRCHRDKVTR